MSLNIIICYDRNNFIGVTHLITKTSHFEIVDYSFAPQNTLKLKRTI